MSKIKKRNNEKESKIKSRESEKSSTNVSTPIFSFEYMQDKYHCIDCCEADDLIALLKRLRTLSKVTWNEIISSQKHGIGCEKISVKAIKEPMPKKLNNPKDINFLSLRFNGKKPMVGFREERVFNIIWIDFDFKVYDHGN